MGVIILISITLDGVLRVDYKCGPVEFSHVSHRGLGSYFSSVIFF
jgi:hypothetical protein